MYISKTLIFIITSIISFISSTVQSVKRDLIKMAISKIVHCYNINHYHYQLFVVEWHHWLVNLVLGQKGAESPGDNHEEPQFDPR